MSKLTLEQAKEMMKGNDGNLFLSCSQITDNRTTR